MDVLSDGFWTLRDCGCHGTRSHLWLGSVHCGTRHFLLLPRDPWVVRLGINWNMLEHLSYFRVSYDSYDIFFESSTCQPPMNELPMTHDIYVNYVFSAIPLCRTITSNSALLGKAQEEHRQQFRKLRRYLAYFQARPKTPKSLRIPKLRGLFEHSQIAINLISLISVKTRKHDSWRWFFVLHIWAAT